MLFFWGLLLLLAFYLLAEVADEYFVPSLERIGERFKFSHDMQGATLMAVGSSAPELAVSAIALFGPTAGNESVGAGTIIGSAIFNILVIIGVSGIVRASVLAWQPVLRDNVFYFVAIVALLLSFWDGQVVWYEALGFVLAYFAYVVAVVKWRNWFPYKEEDVSTEEQEVEYAATGHLGKLTAPLDKLLSLVFVKPSRYWFNFGMSIVMIALLSHLLVESAVHVAEILHIPTVIVALTVLAAGTSIPDLMSSVIVARKGRGGMAISNAVGSNIFDVLFGLGGPWLVYLLLNPGTVIPVDTDNLIGSVVLLLATIVATLFIYIASKWRIGRTGGWVLIVCYVAYLLYAISRAL